MIQAKLTTFFPSPKVENVVSESSVSTEMPSNLFANRKKNLKRRRPFNDPKQLIIDAGQKLNEYCHQCEMLYSIPNEVDEHEKQHNKHIDTICITLSNPTAEYWSRRLTSIQDFDDGVIYEICSYSPKLIRCRIEMLISNHVNVELGFSEHLPIWTSVRKAYVFVTDRPCMTVAIVLVESIETAIGNQSEHITSAKKHGSLLGVDRLWVHRMFRRRRLASRLIDCARCNLLSGCPIPRSSCAFSEPTIDGHSFAVNFSNSDDHLIYRLTK